jgi:hypothetical protein
MAMQATLLNDLPSFIERLDFIGRTSSEDLATIIASASARAKSIPIIELTSEERKALDILAFFDGVELYLNMFHYPEIFDIAKSPPQDAKITAPVVIPDVLQEQGGLTDRCFSGAYNAEELRAYFQILQEVLSKTELEKPIALILNNTSHGLTISYFPETKEWYVTDVRQDPMVQRCSTEELAGKVITSFRSTSLPYTPIASALYSTKSAEIKLDEIIEELNADSRWQAIHNVTDPKVADGHWLYIAAACGDASAIRALTDHHAADVNKTIGGIPPLLMAIQGNRIESVSVLLDQPDIDLNPVGIPALAMARGLGRAEIAELLENKIEQERKPRAGKPK